ncbi:MAG TPA: hypothetical protein VIG68_03185, partial [Lysobacter sp.]
MSSALVPWRRRSAADRRARTRSGRVAGRTDWRCANARHAAASRSAAGEAVHGLHDEEQQPADQRA